MIISGGEDLNQLRWRYIRVLSIASMVVTGLTIPTVVISALSTGKINWGSVITVSGVIALSVLWLILANRNRQRIAGIGLLAMFVFVAVTIPSRETVPLSAAVALVTAAALADPQVFLIANLLVLGRIAINTIQIVLGNPGTIPVELYAAEYYFDRADVRQCCYPLLY